jgi:DnaJ-class molecular chaperone
VRHNKIEQPDRNEKYEKPKVKPKKPKPSGNKWSWSVCTVCDQTGERDGKTCTFCNGRGWVAES